MHLWDFTPLRLIIQGLVLLGLAVLGLWGCASQPLSVESSFISYKQLASYKVDTPDPCLECPDFGQRLTLSWSLPEECLLAKELHLHLFIRYGRQTIEHFSYPITCPKGQESYCLLNEEYEEKEGILACKAEIIADGALVARWRHQLWVEPIELETF